MSVSDDRDQAELAGLALTYRRSGATEPAILDWAGAAGFRSFFVSVRIGAGDACWASASSVVSSWGIKTRSGFTVAPSPPHGAVRAGERYWLVARVGPVVIREPVQVVAVVSESDRCGFAYGTLDGHPVCGEEAFIVHRHADGSVWLTLRSLTRSGRGWWRAAFPFALVAQRWYRRRYLQALVERPAEAGG